MAVINYSKKEISAKIVYYGPSLCGKTTNIQAVYQSIKPDQKGKLVSLATEADRTLFFDFLPIEIANVRGFKTRLHFYTVPGQVFYNSTRRAVLTGVDGIVFVADSQRDKMEENVESLANLEENLNYYGKSMKTIPLVIQYNKRDLEKVVPVEVMDQKLKSSGISVSGMPTTTRLMQSGITGAVAPIGDIVSPPLKDIVSAMNHESVNLYAEHLAKELGKTFRNSGSTEAGVARSDRPTRRIQEDGRRTRHTGRRVRRRSRPV